MDSAPGGHLAPIPPIEAPTAVFVCDAGTAEAATRAAVRAALFGVRPLGGLALLLTIPTAASAYVYGPPGLLAFPIYYAFYLGLLLARFGSRVRKSLPSRRHWTTGAVLATRFGPDTVDIQQPNCRTRIRYDLLSVIAVYAEHVVLRVGAVPAAYPRVLFPDHALAYLRQARENPPAPAAPAPLPPPAQPTVATIAQPDTARAVAGAMAAATTAKYAVALGVAFALVAEFSVLPVLFTHQRVDWTPLFTVGAIGLSLLGLAVARYPRRAARVIEQRARNGLSPGQRVSLTVEGDALEVYCETDRRQIPYAAISRIEVREHAVLLTTNGVMYGYPRELFPDHVLATIRAAAPDADRTGP
ncbi:hypothetical protein [Nocardia stercoris]|uniref:YcxB family protein n=1 Tax=Nocardia stercoris TaxID=2483361 RepID=A0A3M2KYU6_9NOCA|nr:hypothetical protein [Nocardia stercoris]RMI30657.1 hypothetical protein EBN03_21645 [Nocardia stercoris]